MVGVMGAGGVAVTVLVRVPRPVTLMLMVSPGWRKTGGVLPMPTPAGWGIRVSDGACGLRRTALETYGSGGYDVSGLEREAFGESLDQEGDGEDEVVGGGVLPRLAVHDGLEAQDAGEVGCRLGDGALRTC